MQSVFVTVTKLIDSNNYFCKEVFCNNFGRDGMPPKLFSLQEKKTKSSANIAGAPGNEAKESD